MEYLLEEYFFSDEDIHLNAETLLWPRNIGPVFDSNDEVMKIETGRKNRSNVMIVDYSTNSKQE